MNTLSQSGPSTLDSSPTRNLLNSFRDRIQRNGSISSPFRPANSASDAINSELLESPVHDEVATTLNDMNSHIPDDVEETVEVDEFLMSRYDDAINNNENNSGDDASSVDDIDSEDDIDFHDPNNKNWEAKKMNLSNIRVTVSSEDIGISSKLELVKCLQIIQKNVKVKKGTQHFKPNVATPSDATKNFLIYANETFFAEILRIINENEARDGIQNRTTMSEFEKVVRAILLSAFYGKSPSLMESLAKRFPDYQKAIDECGGVTRFRHIINQLKSTKPSYGLTWTSYFKECDSIRRLERIVSENCASIVNHETMRSLTIDDHKFRFRSKIWEQLGITRRKGLKSFGPVMNIACQSPTGLIGAMRISGFRESEQETIKILLKRYCNVESFQEVNMNKGIINGDRGYEFDTSTINAHQFNTTKRNKALPFTFGDCRSQNTQQKKVLESGIKTVYSARKKVNKKLTKQLCAYRSGIGILERDILIFFHGYFHI